MYEGPGDTEGMGIWDRRGFRNKLFSTNEKRISKCGVSNEISEIFRTCFIREIEVKLGRKGFEDTDIYKSISWIINYTES